MRAPGDYIAHSGRIRLGTSRPNLISRCIARSDPSVDGYARVAVAEPRITVSVRADEIPAESIVGGTIEIDPIPAGEIIAGNYVAFKCIIEAITVRTD